MMTLAYLVRGDFFLSVAVFFATCGIAFWILCSTGRDDR